jgi:hypothetical protein
MAAHTQHYPSMYNGQHQQTNPFLMAQSEQHTFPQNYTPQPVRPEPWSNQESARSFMTPRSGGVLFDPITDPMVFRNYGNVESWTESSTDPNYLISPSTHGMPPHEAYFAYPPAQEAVIYRPQVTIPPLQIHRKESIGMQVTPASPTPDKHNFVNYTESSTLFTNSYTVAQNYQPPSPGHSSNGYLPQSPYAPAISPSAVSPGSSSGVFSYQHSDPGMLPDSFPVQQFNQSFPNQGYVAQIDLTPIKTDHEMGFETAQESEASAALKALGKNGGRTTGTHLEPEVAKAAHDMRKISACWHCVLQRDKCGPGDICERCLKRSQRPNADCGLGCIRIKLVELSPYFLPGLVTQMHEDSYLKHFVTQHVHGWGNVEIIVHMTCGGAKMPRIPVKVYEFIPKGNELLSQTQYVTDPRTNKRVARKKISPALGMVHINHNEEKIYDRYISEIVDRHLDDFGELCWMEDDNDFLQKLFKLMTRVKPKNDDEVFPLSSSPYLATNMSTVQTPPRSLSPHRRNLYNVTYPHHCRRRQTRHTLAHALVRRPQRLHRQLHLTSHDKPATEVLLRTPPTHHPSYGPQQVAANLQILQGLRQVARGLCRRAGHVHGARRPAEDDPPRHADAQRERGHGPARRAEPGGQRVLRNRHANAIRAADFQMEVQPQAQPAAEPRSRLGEGGWFRRRE